MLEYLFIFIFGLIIGSFLNVCIYRLPLEQSIAFPPSHCFACGTRLGPLDLIPLLSYFALQGHCRTCHAVISRRYPIVELLTGSLFCLCLARFNLTAELITALIFTAFLLVIALIDYDHQLILDKVLIVFTVAALGVGLFQFTIFDWWDKLLAAVASGALLLLVALVSRGGMGGGDIKFVTVLGLWLGLTGMAETLLLSFILGGIGGGLLLLSGKKGRKDAIPFGPFICVAAFSCCLYGQKLLFWYINNFF
jgi:leader peptidase (prepilin peptidase)/N-methyltransferase